jgi:hypothetical protein
MLALANRDGYLGVCRVRGVRVVTIAKQHLVGRRVTVIIFLESTGGAMNCQRAALPVAFGGRCHRDFVSTRAGRASGDQLLWEC